MERGAVGFLEGIRWTWCEVLGETIFLILLGKAMSQRCWSAFRVETTLKGAYSSWREINLFAVSISKALSPHATLNNKPHSQHHPFPPRLQLVIGSATHGVEEGGTRWKHSKHPSFSAGTPCAGGCIWTGSRSPSGLSSGRVVRTSCLLDGEHMGHQMQPCSHYCYSSSTLALKKVPDGNGRGLTLKKKIRMLWARTFTFTSKQKSVITSFPKVNKNAH